MPTSPKVIYWHRELPPLGVQPPGLNTVETTLRRVLDTLVHRDDVWDRHNDDLLAHTRTRLEQEGGRLGSPPALLDRWVDSRRSAPPGETCLRDLFNYMLYRLYRLQRETGDR